MTKVAAIVFAMVLPNEEGPPQGLRTLRELQAAGSLGVHGTDVLQRGAEGWISTLRSNGPAPVEARLRDAAIKPSAGSAAHRHHRAANRGPASRRHPTG